MKYHRVFTRNATKYPDPDNFRPQRWLEPGWPTYKEPLSQYPTIAGMSSFGWGARICLGQSIVEDQCLLALGGLCWAFDLKFKIDPSTGKKVKIPTGIKSKSLSIVEPEKFQMDFLVRSHKREKVAEMWKTAMSKDGENRARGIEH